MYALKHAVIAAAVLLCCSPMHAGSFPFLIPWDDDSANVTNLSFLNHTPAGSRGWVEVSAGGHFSLDGERVRFVGVNISDSSAFIGCSSAPGVARRLARMGVNVARFHHLDNGWTTNIFSGTTTTSLDESMLERLDCLAAALISEGIYLNLNLLVSRTFVPGDGLPEAISTLEWKHQQTVAMFDPTLIQLQKDYAAQLLGHVNPMTGLAYVDDPAVAFVEILNEHGLIHAWHQGDFDHHALPSPYSDDLSARWNAWLAAAYGAHQQLAHAWATSSPAGDELLSNGDFSQGLTAWATERHEGATAVATTEQGPTGAAARIEITTPGSQGWHVQFKQENLSLEAGPVYTLRFDAKASREVSISVGISQQSSPWASLGFSRPVPLTTQWQSFEYPLQLTQGESAARLIFSNLALGTDTFWFDNVSLVEGGTLGLFPDENLDAASIRIFEKSNQAARNAVAQRDWMSFLWQLEQAYWEEMATFLKQELGYRGIVVGSIVGTSTPNLMASLDAVDTHAYWQHPAFDVSWGSPWQIRNISMLGENGGALNGLANRRVFGKPHTVTEYNTGFPNSFGAETYPLLAAYAAFQDWDGIYAFAYHDADGDTETIGGFFDAGTDPTRILGLWNAALLFRRGDIAPGATLAVTPLDRQTEIDRLRSAGAWSLVDATHVGSPVTAPLLRRVALLTEGLEAPPGSISTSDLAIPSNGIYDAESGQIRWDTAGGVLTLDSPRSKAVMGKSEGEEYRLGEITIRPTHSDQGYSVIHLQLIDGSMLEAHAQRAVITAVGWAANSNMRFVEYPSTPVSETPPPEGIALGLADPNDFGSEPVIAEGIGAEIVLPYRPPTVTMYALDGRGERKHTIPVGSEEGHALLRLSESYETLWYEIVIRQPLTRRGGHRRW